MSLADVTSANIVGYNTVTIAGGKWNMFAVNFENVSSDQGISIQDLIPGTTVGLHGGTLQTGDQIMIHDPTTGNYTTFYLQYVTFPPAAMVNNYKWMNGNGTVATKCFKNGESFWYRSQGEEEVSISISGSVSLEPKQDIDIVNGYNMIGSAFPVNFNPNTLGVEYWQTSGAKGGTLQTGDQVMVHDPETGNYTTYYLQYVTFPPAAMVNNYKWMTASGTALPSDLDVLSVGKAVWYRHQGSGFTLKIPSPIAK